MPERLPVVIAVINSKGGVGKTTTAVNLAGALAGPRTRVLLVDLDSQASASLWCGIARRHLRPSSANCLLEKYPILKAVRHTITANLDILPGSIELANADVALAGVRGRETVLRRTLLQLDGYYDLVVVDCPPNLSLLCINAMVAADALIVPVLPEPLGAQGLETVLQSIELVRTRMGSKLRLLGIVLTMVDPRRKLTVEVSDRLRTQFRDKVFHTEIRWTPRLATAPPDAADARRTAGAASSVDAFRRLAGEVLQRMPAIRR